MAAIERRRIGYWLIMAFAALLTLAALALIGGGAYLIVLGGSWYYALAGLALLATAVLLFRRSRLAVWVYLALFAATVAWALWESGFNGWAQVPRIFTPFVLLLLVLACLPGLRREPRVDRRMAGMAAAGFAILVGAGLLLNGGDRGSLVAQEPTPGVPVEQPAVGADPAPAAAAITFAMPDTGVDWPAYGGNIHATRYSPLDQITPQNVGQLQKVWEFRTGDLPQDGEPFGNQNTPVKVGDRLFVCSALNKISALDAATGAEFWTYEPGVSSDNVGYNASCRGLVYFDNPAAERTALCATRTVNLTHDARMIALDTETGQLCADFGNGGVVNLLEGIGDTAPGFYAPTSPPTLVR
ncbi:MAG: membrane-bound PQQ-dependent dehydrogenase, glucose/quinate/shikimate family, partial [Rubrivivax sp.]